MGSKIKMKFKDAPIGARFNFIGDDAPKDIYVKITNTILMRLQLIEHNNEFNFFD